MPLVSSSLLMLGALSATQFAAGELRLYDCNLGYEHGHWKKLWDPEWTAWCCQHESRGCPTTTTETATVTSITTETGTSVTKTTHTTTTTTKTSTSTITSTTTTTNLGCNTNCTLGSDIGTCADRMRFSFRDVKLLNSLSGLPTSQFHDRLCKAAGKLVKSQCSVCDRVCSVEDFCKQENMKVTMPAKCGATCDFGGSSASCEDRMKWSMEHNAQVRSSSNACLAAGQLVKSQCPVCRACSSEWWCAQHAELAPGYSGVLVRKSEDVDIDGVVAHIGLSKSVSALMILACAASITGFVLIRRRSAARHPRRLLRVSAVDADPLCTLSDTPVLSDSA